jgi:hypothetical protein
MHYHIVGLIPMRSPAIENPHNLSMKGINQGSCAASLSVILIILPLINQLDICTIWFVTCLYVTRSMIGIGHGIGIGIAKTSTNNIRRYAAVLHVIDVL